MPGSMKLDQWARQVRDAFGEAPYLVGSATTTKDWRDVDVRLMLDDDQFYRLFPGITRPWWAHPGWSLLCTALSEHAKAVTGLPVDFQIQSVSHANATYPEGIRHPLALNLPHGPIAALLAGGGT